MSQPPPGYDDDSVIARERLVMLVHRMEQNLNKVEKVVKERLSIESHLPEIQNNFWEFRKVAEELGLEYSKTVEQLIQNYVQFVRAPTEEQLSLVQKEITQLKKLLSYA